MGNWAELPADLLILTARRISLFEDFLSFSGVCRSWRSVAINDNFTGSEQIPWLMLSDKDKQDEQQFVSLRKGGIIRTVHLPEARGKRCLETLGWLVTISQDGDVNLLHPFTRVQINLPNITTLKYYQYHPSEKSNHLSFMHKAVLSSRPEESNDYVLTVTYGCSSRRELAFWRPKDKSWTDVRCLVSCWVYSNQALISFCDINFYKGLCYGVISNGMVFSIRVRGRNRGDASHWHLGRGPREFVGHSGLKLPYIVQSEEVLLIVFRFLREVCVPGVLEDNLFVVNNSNRESRVHYETCGFEVFEVDLSKEGEFVKKTSLGDNALFLGDNSSVSVHASRFRGIRSNCIYYTDDLRRGAGNDMGVYDIEVGSLRPCYEGDPRNLACPPMWVNPPSF